MPVPVLPGMSMSAHATKRTHRTPCTPSRPTDTTRKTDNSTHTSSVRPTDHARKDRQLHRKSHRRQQDSHTQTTGTSQCQPTDVHKAETYSSSAHNASRGAAAHDSISAAAVVKVDQCLHAVGLSVSAAGLTHVHLGLAIIIQLLQRRALCHLGDEMEHLCVCMCVIVYVTAGSCTKSFARVGQRVGERESEEGRG